MAKRWIVGGIWAVLMTVGVVTCGQIAAAEQSRQLAKDVISDVIIQGNRRMTTEQIKNHLRTQPGNEYKSDVVDEDVRQLYKTHEFSNIITFMQSDGAGKVKIFFNLREMPNMVQKVTFLGAKHVKEEELRNLTGVRQGMVLNPKRNRQGCQRIRAKYEKMGRPLTNCELVKGGDLDDTEVIYQITEGPKVKIRDIQFTGNTFVSSARLLTQIKSTNEWFGLIGGTYSTPMGKGVQAQLAKYYRDFGYQDVRVTLETKRDADGQGMTLIFHIHEGPRYRLQDTPDSEELIPLRERP